MHHITKDYATEKGTPIPLHENRIFTVLFNGFYHYIEFHNLAGGSIIVPQFDNGDLLLVRLRRAPVFGFSLEFPRGGVERGETLRQGAVRELSEETGYALTEDAAVLLGGVGPDTATLNGMNHVFLVQIPAGVQAGSYDTEEIDRPVRVSLAEMQKLVRDNVVFDGQTLAAFAMLLVRQ